MPKDAKAEAITLQQLHGAYEAITLQQLHYGWIHLFCDAGPQAQSIPHPKSFTERTDVLSVFFGGGGGADSKCPRVLKIVLGNWVTQVYDTLDPC